MNFPDQNHFEQIRRRLWCNRDFGQASVMVGAGFSRNAEKIAIGTPNMPTWAELGEQMYDELYPQDFSGREKARKDASINPLNLASEYEAVFGRSALNDFLNRKIPNDQYNPGKLHKLLMSLPWSDVFTTNYDSLLERTRPIIHNRKYDLICKHEDIPGKMQPRIIKLHGSFPSHSPFIFTEEDYRSYPKKFAPFVNMVQQSIMENVFCLIGFSGDDPNFLNWIGWVRDNFGDLTPPIYLCGLLNYSDAKKAILKQKNILTIDIAPLFPKDKWPDSSNRHAKALEWFLLSLKRGNPPNIRSWPEPNDVKDNEIKIWEESTHLPELLKGFSPLPDPGDLQPSSSLDEQTFKNQCNTWGKTREVYPGWVICPRSNRENLWEYTKRWVEKTFEYTEKLSAPDDIFILYELNWRLEITLTPLFTHWVSKITACLEKYNPFPEILSIEKSYVRPDYSYDQQQNWDWNKISKAWIELAFSLCRVAREDHDKVSFNLWIDYLDKVADFAPELKSRWFHEKCLFHIFHFEYQQAKQVLEKWPPSLSSDFWEVKRAAVYAELGDLEEAERIAELALDRIRSRQQPYSVDYSLYSQEGWVMYLLQIVKRNTYSDEQWFSSYRERWSQLENFLCNPHDELGVLSERMDRVPEPMKLRKEEKKSFYPGTITKTYHYSTPVIWYSALPAFNILRMLEEAGIPIRCGSVVPYDAGKKAAKWIRPYSPLWSITTIIRSRGNSEYIDEFFTFTYIAVLSQENINQLHLKFYNFLLNYTHGNQNERSLVERSELERVEIIIKLTSRICFRLDDERLRGILNVVISFYRNARLLSRISFSNAISELFNGIFYTLTHTEIIHALPELLSLPIAGERGFESLSAESFPEPFDYININRNDDSDNKLFKQIQYLILIINQSNSYTRSRAIKRIDKLFRAGLLNNDEQYLLAEALWSKLDAESQLPMSENHYKFTFLSLPELKPGESKQRFVEFLLSKAAFGLDNNKDIHYFQEWISSTKQPFVNSEVSVDWSLDNIICLTEKILSQWNQYKKRMSEDYYSFNQQFKDEITDSTYKLIEVLSYVVFPHLCNGDDELKKNILEIVNELENAGFCVAMVLPMTLFILPDNFDQVSQKMRESLTSISADEIQRADLSLFRWLNYSCENNIPKPSSDLLDILVGRVLTRHQPGLNTATDVIATIITEMPDQLNNKQLNSLFLALKYLLEETKLPTIFEFEMEISSKSSIVTNDRPEYQKLCSQLAFNLHKLFSRQEKDIPDILTQWKELAENSILPEVRKIWM